MAGLECLERIGTAADRDGRDIGIADQLNDMPALALIIFDHQQIAIRALDKACRLVNTSRSAAGLMASASRRSRPSPSRAGARRPPR